MLCVFIVVLLCLYNRWFLWSVLFVGSVFDGSESLCRLCAFLQPLAKVNFSTLFVILFVYGWNDYLWPLIVTNSPEMRTAVIGIDSLIPRTSQLPEWNVAMAAAMMVLLPPVVVIVVMQRWFVKGLIETEK